MIEFIILLFNKVWAAFAYLFLCILVSFIIQLVGIIGFARTDEDETPNPNRWPGY